MNLQSIILFQLHSPSPNVKEDMSITSGITGPDFHSVKMKPENRVLPISVISMKATTHDSTMSYTFERIVMTMKNQEDLAAHFSCKLAPIPMSLFDELGMRKPNRADFYNLF
ncbi:hypothetical protein PR048_008940 [Dryococelus australis]|uniref:Uncharacterized protein n=1 Tax=Dryococelus australis TaxID=614101 RepID=A0ABQ9HYH9_9NEOP|nr:hypothetical protein PR048_008940 [Dryococelus australis]